MRTLLAFVFLAAGTANSQESLSIENRIAGGIAARPAQFPFQVYLRITKRQDDYEYKSNCGGSLISEDLVLTAAHCLHRGISTEVFLGVNDISQEEPTRVVIDVPQANLIIHEHYNNSILTHDIALIKLTRKVQLNDYIQTIKLPNRNKKTEDFVRKVGWISGWGRLGDGKSSSKVLQFARKWILPSEYCEEAFSILFQKDRQLCLDASQGVSTCRGDSGGPLFIEEEDRSRTVVGITSFGDVYCEKGKPGVYTSVVAYLDWIAQNSNN